MFKQLERYCNQQKFVTPPKLAIDLPDSWKVQHGQIIPEEEFPDEELDSWPKRYLIRLLAMLLVAGGLYYSQEGLVVLIVLFIAVVPFEKLFPRHKGQRIRRPELGTDIGYAIATPLMGVAATVVVVIIGVLSFAWVPGLLIRPLVAKIPIEIAPYVGFLLFDFAVYWTHRFYHEIDFLWKFHAIHHSTETLDWVSGFRGHPFDGTLLAPAFFFLIAAGFTAELTGIFVVLQILLGLFLHANVRWKLKPLHRLFITPEFHHWHHTNEEDAIWTNYSTFLPIWDMIFGTYFMPKNRRPAVYGCGEDIPKGIIKQLKWPMPKLINPFWVIRHPLKSIANCWRFTKKLLKAMKGSAFRPRGSKPGFRKGVAPNPELFHDNEIESL